MKYLSVWINKFFLDLNIQNFEPYFDPPITLAKKFSLRGVPTSILIDKTGKEFARIIGSIDFDKQIYLYNLNDSGKPGFEVINPILIGNENYLINRGWIPFDKKNKAEINTLDTNAIIGTLKTQSKANSFKPDNDINENYWFTLNRDDIFSYTGKNFSKYIIYLNGDYKAPKPKVITSNISNNHKKYAITWFSMAISILLIYLYFRKKNY